MRVTKDQIINGIVSYVEDEVVPRIEDKATKIILSAATLSIRANPTMIDSIFGHPTVRMLLEEGSDGSYETNTLFESISKSVREYGPFPVSIPPVPFISPSVKLLSFTADDISEIRRRIERST